MNRKQAKQMAQSRDCHCIQGIDRDNNYVECVDKIFDFFEKKYKKLEKRIGQLVIEKAESYNRFDIDFFEFSFLVEACIPPRPIARAMFWDDVIDKYYHVLSPDERKRLFEWITRNSYVQTDNEDFQIFVARYNPENQYSVKTLINGTENNLECFKWKDRYHTSKTTSIIEDYIVEITKSISKWEQ